MSHLVKHKHWFWLWSQSGRFTLKLYSSAGLQNVMFLYVAGVITTDNTVTGL